MRPLVLFSCVLFLCLPGFGQAELKADLMSHAADAQVATHLMALSEKTHEPSQTAVSVFARDFDGLLRLRQVREPFASRLVAEIDAVLKSAGTSTAGFYDHVARFETILEEMGVSRLNADRVGAELEKIGRQVRGPEDTPVKFEPARFRR